MESDTDRKVLRQLVWIKWTTTTIAVAFVAIAATFGWSAWLMNAEFGSDHGERLFSDKVSEMLDKGREQEVLSLADDREKECPKDVFVYWYRGRALYQLGRFEEARAAFSKAEELSPSWKVGYTEPYISSIKLKLGSGIPAPAVREAPNPPR